MKMHISTCTLHFRKLLLHIPGCSDLPEKYSQVTPCVDTDIIGPLGYVHTDNIESDTCVYVLSGRIQLRAFRKVQKKCRLSDWLKLFLAK